ncbi:3308_t:CDS:2 [Diversispora eburnea]|uniref:3308_t:CDS:1 n=1 Tax=Diversispora eburnea TaxID=1213867 RepID=A0A9N9CSX3_9GLOM|nr:3308_t:CDS:2 [Diversispora eburnea]
MQSEEEEEIIDFKQITNEPVELPTEDTKRAASLAPSAHEDDIDNYYKIKLSNIYFGANTKETCMMGTTHNDFGLIFRPASRFPYVHEPILKNFDPTKGMFSKITNIILNSYNPKSFDILVEKDFARQDKLIETEKHNQTSDSNSPMTSSSPNKSTPSLFNDNNDNELPEISTDSNSTSYVSITQTTTRTRTYARGEDTLRRDGELLQSKTNTRKERSPSNPLVQSQPPPPSKIQTAFNSTRSQIQPSSANSDQSSFNSHNFNKSVTPPPQQQSKSVPKTTKFLSNIQDSTHEELYITCTFPTERRAILYSIEGSLYHLNYCIREKFNKQNWKNSWYKYEGEWKPLVDEDDWKAAKFSKKKVKGYIRIEICLR